MLLMHDFLETILFRDETDSERFLKKMFSNLREAFVSKKTRKRSIRLFRFYRGIWPAISRGLGAAGPFQLTITSFTRAHKGICNFALAAEMRVQAENPKNVHNIRPTEFIKIMKVE